MTKQLTTAIALCVGLCDGYTQFYGATGQSEGYANSIGGYTQFYGPTGQSLGYANTTGTYTQFYNSDGTSAGYANSTFPMGESDD